MRRLLRPAGFAVSLACALGVDVSIRGQVFDPSTVVKPQSDPGADAPEVAHRGWQWDFGEPLSSGAVYTFTLKVENLCSAPQTVSIFVNDLPDLTLDLTGCQMHWDRKSCATVVPPGTTEVPGKIASDPFFYYVDPMAPWATPRPFKRVTGEVVVLHASQGDCEAVRDQYAVQYDLGAIQGAIEPPPPGPERIAGAGPCQVWWNTGVRPDMLEPEDRCEPEIRPLAIGFRERVLAPHVAAAPAEWAWLPSADAMLEMSSEQLVAMKRRAEDQLAAGAERP